ncbi:MAG: tRNA 4-thiouridine(8) synthase ThiI [Clostridiaceae bacterium]
MTRALALISGGLDSLLSAKLIKDQGIEVIGITFRSYFFNEENALRMINQIGIELKIVDFSENHYEMLKNPKHGYGKNMNPCIDCHAMMLNYAGKLLEEMNADFLITGEVLNQRPMSQKKSGLDIVKRDSNFSDKILRPLCAKMLPPTEMELNGLVDREKLLDISGRSRKRQMELAEMWNIKDYPSPAGGCSLTEPNFSRRLKDLMDHNEFPTQEEVESLKLGRHFRVSDNVKVISSRTEEEGNAMKKLLNDNNTIFIAKNFNGSLIVLIGEGNTKDLEIAAKITARYSKGKNENKVLVNYGKFGAAFDESVEVKPATEEEINQYII